MLLGLAGTLLCEMLICMRSITIVKKIGSISSIDIRLFRGSVRKVWFCHSGGDAPALLNVVEEIEYRKHIAKAYTGEDVRRGHVHRTRLRSC